MALDMADKTTIENIDKTTTGMMAGAVMMGIETIGLTIIDKIIKEMTTVEINIGKALLKTTAPGTTSAAAPVQGPEGAVTLPRVFKSRKGSNSIRSFANTDKFLLATCLLLSQRINLKKPLRNLVAF